MCISLIAYHAGLNSKVRSSVLDDWLSSRTQVVVATVAFGYCFSSVLFTPFQSFVCWFLVHKFQFLELMFFHISCIFLLRYDTNYWFVDAAPQDGTNTPVAFYPVPVSAEVLVHILSLLYFSGY